MTQVAVIGGVRTPFARARSVFHHMSPAALGGVALRETVSRLAIDPSLIEDIANFLQRWIAEFEHDQRSYLTVALGCTGGQHRSVYCAEQLAKKFQGQWPCLVRHRGLSLKGLG